MRRLLTVFIVLEVAFLAGCTADQPAPKATEQGTTSSTTNIDVSAADHLAPSESQSDDSFEALKRGFDEDFKTFKEQRLKAAEAELQVARAEQNAARKAVEDAQTDEEKRAAETRLRNSLRSSAVKAISPADGPGETYSPRFLAFAVKNPKDSSALDALYMALVTSGGPSGQVGTWSGALAALQADHVENPDLKREVRLLRMLAGSRDIAADHLLRDVIQRNPDRRAQGRACQALALGRASAAALGERLKTNADFARNVSSALGGKEGVERLIADARAAMQQAEELTRVLREKYDDVCPDLSIGKPAPEVASHDVDGTPVKLSSLKGKVVVLDIWATWCGPCRAMIPHERAMVDRLKDKPFVLVSISTDQEKETLTKFLANGEMPWTHWWNGNDGGIVEDWNVEAYPTIYVLDAQGVIRHKDLRGEQLEKAVNELLNELELKKST